jgi:hypothetical protein
MMPTPRKANPQKRGRKPAWRDGYLEQARKLAALGAIDIEMADFFGVSLKTFTRWKVSKPEFRLALKVTKEAADERVERRLWERAVGYAVEIEKIVVSRGKVIRVKTIEHYPPDTTACIFWLKNRQPEKWRDKVDPGLAATQYNFIGMLPSEEEWLAKYASNPEPLVINQQGGTQWSESSELDDDDADLD